MSEETALALVGRYESWPLLRALVQLVPFGVGGAADSLVMTQYNKLKAERTEVFFDQLASGDIAFRKELAENNDFIHCFMATSSAVQRTHQKEKIVSLANLLIGAVSHDRISGVDEYEEYLSIIEELSIREFNVLSILFRYENSAPVSEHGNSLTRANAFWSDFQEEVQGSVGIPKEELAGFLTRLTRTGCFEIITGAYIGYGGGRGYTTPLYARIRAFIVANSG